MDVTFFLVLLFLMISMFVSIYLKDVLNPLFVLVLPLSLQYALYYFYLSSIYVLSDMTNLLLVVSLSSFTAGFLWLLFIPMIKPKTDKETNMKMSIRDFRQSKSLFLFLGTFGYIVGVLMAIRFGLSGPGGFFFNLRYTNTITNENTGGISVYLMLFFNVIILAMVIFRKEWNIKVSTLLFLVVLLVSSASFTMSRTNLLMTFASVLGVYVFSNRYIHKIKVKKKALVFTIGGFGLLAYLFALGTQKLSSDSNIFFNYLVYPLITFDNWIVDFPIKTNGSITFTFLYKILGSLGVIEYSPINIGEFLGVQRGEFNTFTFMSAPYLDFGIAGIFFIFVGLGMFFGFIYKRVRAGRPYWIIFNSIMLYPLIMSFFEYQYNLSTYIYYSSILIFVYLYGKLFKIKNVNLSVIE